MIQTSQRTIQNLTRFPSQNQPFEKESFQRFQYLWGLQEMYQQPCLLPNNIPEHVYSVCLALATQQLNLAKAQSSSNSNLSVKSAFPLCVARKRMIPRHDQALCSFPPALGTATNACFPISGPEIEMAPSPEEAISEWIYTPLHPNSTIAASLAYLDFMAANQEMGFTFGGIIMNYGHIHLNLCSKKSPQHPCHGNVSAKDDDNTMEWTYDYANHPYYSRLPYMGISNRDVIMAINQWRYVALHPDPVTAAVLAHLSFNAANKVAGFSFADAMMQLGREHLEYCIPRTRLGIFSQVQVTTSIHPTPIIPIIGSSIGERKKGVLRY